ncbi:MAG: phage portal protein [Desulfobacterales bacterium]
MTNFFDRIVGYFDPVRALKRQGARAIMASGFKAADVSRLRGDWMLPGQGSDADPSGWDLSVIRERSRDSNRNDPVAAGATDTMKVNVVGRGLQPQSQIRADVIGISEDRAAALRRQAESAFRKWAPHADAANRLHWDDIQFLAFAKVVEDGEAICVPSWANEKWRPYGRCLELIESERLSSPAGERKRAKNGIQFGSRGEPVKYWIRRPGATGLIASDSHVPIAARDSKGRPKILHVYPQKRPGQSRGIPFFAPVLTYFKDLASYLEATVVTARVAACLAVFVTKENPLQTALNLGGTAEAGTSARVQGIEPGMVAYLNQGEKINVVDPKQPGDVFPSFVEALLRIIGMGIGMPYELIAKDFSKTNYSSARASLLEGRRMFDFWRYWWARQFCQPVWDLVLEEAFLRGEFDAPDFYRWRHEYTRAKWLGGGWGWVDPVKEVQASRLRVDYGFSTLADEVSSMNGQDWEEVADQRAREIPIEIKNGVLPAAKAAQPRDTEASDGSN